VGLVARSYWISHEQALAANPDDGIPLARARVIGPDAEGEDIELAPALASEQNLHTIRVLWVRKPGDSSSMANAMGRTETSIRRLIPQQGLALAFTELLVPETLRDLAIPVPPPDWHQFVVEPRDRPSPSGSDSYYDVETAPRQGLHTALMIGGILGGSNSEQTAPRDAQDYRPWVVHPFTRAVRGADRARRETHAVLREKLATISAADVAPDRFYAPEAPEDSDYIDDAVSWVRMLDDESLRFHRPDISFQRRGQSFVEFLVEILKFVGWALKGMFGIQRWKDLILMFRGRVARRLESEDYGATIDANAPTPKGLDLEDWDAREAEAQAAAAPRILAASRADGRIPAKFVWQSIAALVPSLIDGSSPPPKWTPRTRFDHVYVLPPKSVVRTEATIADASSIETGLARVSGEISGIHRIGKDEFSQALYLAGLGVGDGLARIDSPTGVVTRTAQGIADQAKADESDAGDAFRSAITSKAPASPIALPLLGRLRAAVVCDLLLARLAADHLASMSKSMVPSALEKLRKMIQDATWVVLGTLIVGLGLIAFVVHFSTQIDALFALLQLAFPTSWTQVMSIIISTMVAVLVFIFGRLFYVYHAYNEVGRRRLEYVDRRAEAAVAAYEERNRLRNGERILAAWEDILSSIGARDVSAQLPIAPIPKDLPDALQIAEPDIDDTKLGRLVVQHAIEPEWFGNAFKEIRDIALDRDEQEVLWQDEGLPGGPLGRLRETALDGDIQRAWWEAWTIRVADKVVAKLAAETQSVRPLGRRSGASLIAKEFFAEITRGMEPEYRPGSDYEELFDTSENGQRSVSTARQGSEDYRSTPALTAVETVLVHRRLGRLGSAKTQRGDRDAIRDPETGRA
jgi:hypothetical protein